MDNMSELFDSFGETIHVEDVELPNGGIYKGDAIKKIGSKIEISGKGEVVFPNGDQYVGEWKYGYPYGYGTYLFKDGDFHKGWFNDYQPKGPGYLCINTTRSMNLGFYTGGKLDGWGISMRPGGIAKLSFYKDGTIVKDHTSDFQWMFDMLSEQIFTSYQGNMIQISPTKGYIRFGAPSRTAKIGSAKYEKKPIGFLFSTDKNLYIGLIDDHCNLNGCCIKCTPDHQIISGRWENNEFIKKESFEEIEAWTDIKIKTERYTNIIQDCDDNLPF